MATIQSIQRAFKILSFFSMSRVSLGIGELSDLMGVPRGTVHGIVRTMVEDGFLRQDHETRKYRLGLKVFELGTIFANTLEINQVANDPVHSLAVSTKLDVRIAIWDRDAILFTMGASGRSLPLFEVGPRTSAYCTASGRAILAYLPSEELEAYFERAELLPYTDHTNIDQNSLMQELKETCLRGYAVSRQEYLLDRNSIAAPIFERNGTLAASISLSGTTGQLMREQEEDLAVELLKTANLISRKMGYYPEEFMSLRKHG